MKMWKIVRQQEKKGKIYYSSLFAYGKADMAYPVGKKTRAPEWLEKEGYYPTVFPTEEAASRYLNEHVSIAIGIEQPKILVVETGAIKPLPPRINLKKLAKGKIIPISVKWSEETIMVEWIKIPKEK